MISTATDLTHNFESRYASEHFAHASSIINTPVAESQSFVAVPSLGALVEGWVLIVPKNPHISVGAIPRELHQELGSFLEDVRRLVESIYGRVVIFEHGPSTTKSLIGCGVDYAHIHVVPIGFDVLGEAQLINPSLEWRESQSLECCSIFHAREQPYLYFFQSEFHNKPFIADATLAPSQLFRRAIAKGLGRPDKYDWKTNPEFENVAKTIVRLHSVTSSRDWTRHERI